LELDPAKIYIIGGIVDRNRYKSLTLNKAKEDGIAHARLPIGELMALRSSAVLAVNHVFEIVSQWFNNRDWKHALDKVIPERKQQSVK
jgi:tRNA (guanine9-N1)-methyltransferase